MIEINIKLKIHYSTIFLLLLAHQLKWLWLLRKITNWRVGTAQFNDEKIYITVRDYLKEMKYA